MRTIWLILLFLVAIGIAAVTRRTLQLLHPTPPPPRFAEAAALDAGFARHRLLTLAHILPGLLFVVLAPLQFARKLRTRHPALHRWNGRIVLAAGVIVGATALIMSPQMAIGGMAETAATSSFAILCLFALTKAYLLIRRGEVALHREWMIRAFAIGLAVTTTRPIVGFFFATERLTHLTPHEFFGIAFWLGFSIHLIAAEVWINRTRRRLNATPLRFCQSNSARESTVTDRISATSARIP
jgi:uncharacterized membrane protein